MITSDQEYYFSFVVYEGSVNRLSGEDRYETSVAISNRLGGLTENIILATGKDFPDALAADSLSVQMCAPILLTRNTQLPDSVKKFITNSMVKKAVHLLPAIL